MPPRCNIPVIPAPDSPVRGPIRTIVVGWKEADEWASRCQRWQSETGIGAGLWGYARAFRLTSLLKDLT